MQADHSNSTLGFTVHELLSYSGEDGPVFITLQGGVYDVSVIIYNLRG
jgi:predicted heme/steroid binding protein